MDDRLPEIPQIKPRSIVEPPEIQQIDLNRDFNHENKIMMENQQTSFIQTPKVRRRLNISPKAKKIIIGVSSVFVLLILLVGVFVGMPAYAFYKQAMVLKADLPRAKEIVKSQDIVKIKDFVNEMDGKIAALDKTYQRMSWMKMVPVAGYYFRDGSALLASAKEGIEASKIVIETVEPYADIIGLKGGKADNGGGVQTANDRVEFLLATMSQVLPRLDDLSVKVSAIKSQVETINPSRYPESFRGTPIRENIVLAKTLLGEIDLFITDGKPLLQKMPYLLGMESPRTYLVLFQNDKELRPTGGFLTAYSIMKLDKGKPQPVSSSDIYSLDDKYTPSVPAPEAIVDYIKGPYLISKNLRIRDMNWSPDFKESMDLFVREAKKTGIGDFDGIIAVDTQVVVNILNVIGKIGVSGFGNFSTENDPRCNCPQVIYELENFADVEGAVVWDQNDPTKIIFAPKNYGKNRKEIVGPLMNSVLSNALGQPKEKLPALFQAGIDSVFQKHILFYSLDEETQKASEGFKIAGRIEDYDGDYLHINNANLGGRKSNLYVTEEVNKQTEITADGKLKTTLDITYKNTQKSDGWLNSVLPSWIRVYVPQGSTLESFEGLEKKNDLYDEFGKTVFSGLYRLRPEGVVKLKLIYVTPLEIKNKEYKLLIQKQPGVDAPIYSVKVNKQKQEFVLKTDHEIKMQL